MPFPPGAQVAVPQFLATAASSNRSHLLDPFGPPGRPPLIWQLVPLGLGMWFYWNTGPARKQAKKHLLKKGDWEESAKKGMKT